MKVNIKIECDNAGELISRLSWIIDIVKVRSRGDDKHEFECGTQFSDNNTYGKHDVEIIPEEEKEDRS